MNHKFKPGAKVRNPFWPVTPYVTVVKYKTKTSIWVKLEYKGDATFLTIKTQPYQKLVLVK